MIPLSNTKAVKKNNIEGVANFRVDLSKVNMEEMVREIGEERVRKMLKIIVENNTKILEL